MWPQYLGPLIILSRNREGAYIILELNGSVFDPLIAAFRIIPYFARTKIDLSHLDKLLDISWQQFQELKDSADLDPEDNDEANSSDPLPDDYLLQTSTLYKT